MIPGFGRVARPLAGRAPPTPPGKLEAVCDAVTACSQGEADSGELKLDDSIAHVKSCKNARCFRCCYLRNRESWEEATRLRLHGKALAVSWLTQCRSEDDIWGIGCWVCKKAGKCCKYAAGAVRSGNLKNIQTHTTSVSHQLSLDSLGMDSDVPDLNLAPAAGDFAKVLKHRQAGNSLSQGILGIGGRFKLSQMQWALAEAARAETRKILSESVTVCIGQDCRKAELLMRYTACDKALSVRRGMVGSLPVEGGETITNTLKTMEKILMHVFDGDQAAMKNFAKKVSIFVADAASSEQGSGREAGRALFPNLLTIQRDRSHAATRVFKRPWEADSEISGLLQTFVFDKTCICRKIENSPVLQGVFARYVQQQGGNVASSRKSLQAAKHCFASYSQPLGRLILHWDAVLSTLIWVSANRDGDEAKQATDFLAELSEERLVLLSMAADLADECICFVRLYDRESYDVSETAFEVSAFLSRLHHLVNEAWR